MQTVKLNNGVEMPVLGYGTMFAPEQTQEAVLEALAAGYRLIDTAAAYKNEAEVGSAIRKSGIPREEIFVTSKLWPQDFGYENAKKVFEAVLDKMGLDYLDLYLIHQPYGDYYGAWRALEELYEDGKIRAIGISNFTPNRMIDLCMNVKVLPTVNQVEIHPFCQQTKALEFMKEFDIKAEAWGPFAEGQKEIFQTKTLLEIGEKYNKSVAQVILRWHYQRDVIAIPKTVHKERMAENINIFDFELSEEDMVSIAAMDTGCGLTGDPNAPEIAKIMGSMKLHD